MPKASDITILEVNCTFEAVPFRSPLKFGGRIMDKSTLCNVEVRVENKAGRKESGFGSMPLGSVWAWPTDAMTIDQTEQAMKDFALDLADIASDFPDYGHPIDIMLQLSGEFEHQAQHLAKTNKQAQALPALAQLVAASPLDAALHDAFGRVNGKSSYDLLTSKQMSHDLSEYLDPQFKGEYLDKYTLREPKPRMPLYHLVGALDPLTTADVAKKVGDGLPETLGEWIAYNGLTHLKIKLAGDQIGWDVDRTLAIEKVAAEAQAKRGCKEWYYSVDFNEKCPNVEYVLDFLKQVGEKSPAAYERIQYIEQPTHRNLAAHPENKMHAAAQLKPVVIDESLIDFESLLLAREQGYSGVALKACKGQTESLLLAAAAQKFNMFLCVQDLTCPGSSFLHSASLAARIPGVVAVEGNGRQYCPAANRVWKTQLPTMFEIKDGTVETGVLNGLGLGF